MKNFRLIFMFCLISFGSIISADEVCQDTDWDKSLSRYENWQKKAREYCKPSSHVIRVVSQSRTLFRESDNWMRSIHKDGAKESIAFAKRGDRSYSSVGAYLYAIVHKKNPYHLENANSGVSTIKNDRGSIVINSSFTHTMVKKAENEEHAAELKKTIAMKNGLNPSWSDDYTQCINQRNYAFNEKTRTAQCKEIIECTSTMPYEKFKELMNNCTLALSDL